MLMENAERFSELASPQHIHVLAPSPMGIRTEDSPSENTAHILERLEVATVRADLERRLLPISGEGAFAHDQSHGVPE